MRARIAGVLVALAAAVVLPGGERTIYTSRTHMMCPILISDIGSSGEFGFESVTMLNESRRPVRAVNLRVTLSIGHNEEESIDGGRFPVELAPGEKKRVDVNLAKARAVELRARSVKEPIVRAVVFVESVEFDDGSMWNENGPVLWLPDAPAKKK